MLLKYRPFNELAELNRPWKFFDEALNSVFAGGEPASPWTPAVDIAETENELVLKADVPEVKPEDIEVQFENGTLTLKGKRGFEKKEDGKAWHRIERSYGAFMRAFTLPETVDSDKLKADFNNGVLTVTIGKKEIAKPKSVKVNISAN